MKDGSIYTDCDDQSYSGTAVYPTVKKTVEELTNGDFDDVPTTFVAPSTSCPQLLIDAGCYYQGYLFSHDHQCQEDVRYDFGYTYCAGCYPYSDCGYIPPKYDLPAPSETTNAFNEADLWSCTPMLLWNTEFR